MPKFNYVAMNQRGKEEKGTLDVASQNEAINRLKDMGFFPTKVTEATAEPKKGAKGKKRGKKTCQSQEKGQER
jgi:type IV pilus assembly protein PilC